MLSLTEKFRAMQASQGLRVTMGKSAIHGWGVFTKRRHRKNDLVIEYVGEMVRPSVADMRERHTYNSYVGAGTRPPLVLAPKQAWREARRFLRCTTSARLVAAARLVQLGTSDWEPADVGCHSDAPETRPSAPCWCMGTGATWG